MKTKKHNCYVLFTDDSEMHREDVCNYKGRIKIFHNDKMNLVTEGKKYKLLLRGYSPKTELDGRRVWVEGFLKHGKLYATVVFLKGDKETDKIMKKHNTKRDNQSAEEIFLKKYKSVEETKDVEEIRKEVNPFLSLMNMEDLYEDSKEEKSPFSESRKSGVFEMSVKHVKRILGSYAMELEHEGKVYETSVSNIKNVEELLGKKIMVDGMIDGMIDHLIVHSICLKEDYERYAPKIEMEKLQLLCGAVGAERKKIEEMMETVDIQKKEGVSVDASGRLFNLSTDQEMQNFYPLVRQYMPMQVIQEIESLFALLKANISNAEKANVRRSLRYLMNFQWEKLIGSYDKKVIIEEMQKGIIGRKKEIQKIAGAFCRTENRQVVLLGADGSGRELLIRALGNAAGVPIIEIDMGGVRMEDSCMFGSGRYYENGDASLFFKKLFRQGTHSILWLKRIDHLHKSMEASVVTLLTGVLNDCFLEVDIPLNNTFIIATAEDGNCIPDAVMGKTEEIVLPEYNAEEKGMILKKNFEELLCMNGIEDDVQLSSEAANYLLGASILEGVSDIGMDLKRIVENIAG